MEDTAFEHKAKTIVIITFYRQTANCNKCCKVWGARKEYKEIFFRSDDLGRPLRRTKLAAGDGVSQANTQRPFLVEGHHVLWV